MVKTVIIDHAQWQNRRKSSMQSVFLTIWHYILNAEFTKTHSFRLSEKVKFKFFHSSL